MPQNTTKNRRPTHNIMLLPAEGDDSKQSWPFIGAAWENRDGSFNMVFDKPVPAGHRAQLKKRKAKAAASRSL